MTTFAVWITRQTTTLRHLRGLLERLEQVDAVEYTQIKILTVEEEHAVEMPSVQVLTLDNLRAKELLAVPDEEPGA
jgi:hypothetical protein